MSIVRWLLLLNALAALGYAVGLVAVPGALSDLAIGPESAAWTRHLVPVYLALGLVSCAASRLPDPQRRTEQ